MSEKNKTPCGPAHALFKGQITTTTTTAAITRPPIHGIRVVVINRDFIWENANFETHVLVYTYSKNRNGNVVKINNNRRTGRRPIPLKSLSVSAKTEKK